MNYSNSGNSVAGLGTGLFVTLGVIYLVVIVVAIWANVNIIRRAGYSGWWVLIGLVPVVNLVMYLIFAFKEWPVTRELNALRAQVGGYGGGPGYGNPGYPPPGNYPPQGGYPQQ